MHICLIYVLWSRNWQYNLNKGNSSLQMFKRYNFNFSNTKFQFQSNLTCILRISPIWYDIPAFTFPITISLMECWSLQCKYYTQWFKVVNLKLCLWRFTDAIANRLTVMEYRSQRWIRICLNCRNNCIILLSSTVTFPN